jgi:hypothetical protein
MELPGRNYRQVSEVLINEKDDAKPEEARATELVQYQQVLS